MAPGGVGTAACEGGALRRSGTRLYHEFLAGDDSSRFIIEGLDPAVRVPAHREGRAA
ncbi:MAG TPA: hypothetical protein VMH28_28065 [Candidatus Acidoferrales bacterium]|nr:hypothetical protein [Candidatus Acidoferrales bacterium]